MRDDNAELGSVAFVRRHYLHMAWVVAVQLLENAGHLADQFNGFLT
jgi:hypothetical protein